MAVRSKSVAPTKEFLIDKTIKVKVLKAGRSPVIIDAEGGSEAYMLQGTSVSIPAPVIPALQGGNGSFVDIFANEFAGEDGAFEKGREMQAELEKALGYAEGDLDPRVKPTDDITKHVLKSHAYRVVLTKTDLDMESASIVLNLRNPSDFIKYLICKNSPLCSPSWEARKGSNNYMATIFDEEEAQTKEFSLEELRDKIVFKLYSLKEAKKRDILYATYRLFDELDRSYRPARHLELSSPLSAIYIELGDAVKGAGSSIKRLKLIESVLDRSEKELKEQVLFHYAEAEGMIIKDGDLYKDKELTIIGPTRIDVIKWMNAAKQSAFKSVLKAKVEADS